MDNIQFTVLNGFDIQSDIIRQYIELYSAEYPKFTRELKFESFLNFLKKNESIKVIIAVEEDKLIGWLMISFAENQGLYHLNMLVHREFQRIGIGSQLLTHAKVIFNELYGVVVPVSRYKRRDGTQYQTPIDFYKKNGFLPTGKKFIEYKNVQVVEIKWSNNST